MNKMHNTRYLPSNVCFLILNLWSSFYIFVWTEEVVNVIVQFARFEPQNSFSLTQAWMEHGVIFSIGNQLFRYGFRLFEKIENSGNCQPFSYIDRKNALYFQYWKTKKCWTCVKASLECPLLKRGWGFHIFVQYNNWEGSFDRSPIHKFLCKKVWLVPKMHWG